MFNFLNSKSDEQIVKEIVYEEMIDAIDSIKKDMALFKTPLLINKFSDSHLRSARMFIEMRLSSINLKLSKEQIDKIVDDEGLRLLDKLL